MIRESTDIVYVNDIPEPVWIEPDVGNDFRWRGCVLRVTTVDDSLIDFYPPVHSGVETPVYIAVSFGISLPPGYWNLLAP